MVDKVKLKIVLVCLLLLTSECNCLTCCNRPLIAKPTQPKLPILTRQTLIPTATKTTAKPVPGICKRADESTLLGISCPPATAILIKKAWYGALDPAVCSANSSSVIQCYRDVTANVSSICGYRTNCALVVSNNLFGGDPCFGSVKQLDVEYFCRPGPCVRSSENKNIIILCPSGSKIVVNKAWYGVLDPTTCSSNSTNAFECYGNVTSNVTSICQNRNTCAVNVTATVFGDPGFGRVKLLDVEYLCQPTPGLQQIFACEDTNMTITCPINTQIFVNDAYFGSLGPVGSCVFGGDSAFTCFRDATSQLSTACNGISSCTVLVNRINFGDSCAGTSKYLQANYNCTSV